MADIDLERKEHVNWWWWLLALIIIAFIIYLLAGSFGARDEVAIEETVTTTPATEVAPQMEPTPGASASAASERFIQDCAASGTSAMTIDHEHTSTCIENLLAAIDGIAPADELQSLGLTEEMQDARVAADRLTASPQDTARHAEMTREAFTSIADVVDDLQQERYPELDEPVDRLSDAAEAIRSDQPLLDQRAQVQGFFTQAGEVVRRMMNGTAQPGTV